MNTSAAHSNAEDNANRDDELEASKIQSEVLLNRADRLLKRIEARRLLAKPLWVELTVPGATVIVALVGFLGTFAATYIKGWYDLELTRQKYTSDLILKAVVTDAKQSRENLQFLLEAGLLNDPDGKVRRAIADPNLSIRLATQVAADLQHDFTLSQMQTLVEEIKKASDTKAAIQLRVIENAHPNAYARDNGNGTFEILYTQGFVDTMRRITGSNWTAYFIVAHEMGHIALNHMKKISTSSITIKQSELEADEWAGRVLAKLGANIAEATAVSTALPKAAAGSSFASSEERQSAIVKGWHGGKEPKTTVP